RVPSSRRFRTAATSPGGSGRGRPVASSVSSGRSGSREQRADWPCPLRCRISRGRRRGTSLARFRDADGRGLRGEQWALRSRVPGRAAHGRPCRPGAANPPEVGLRENGPVRVSAKADYALRAAAELAAAEGEGPVKGEQLARAQSIPPKFLENILLELRHAGLVQSQRGAEGGYWLARPASEITLAHVIPARH